MNGILYHFTVKKANVHKIIIGDSRQMKEIDDNSIDLVVTSPPYWQLKDYGSEKDMGFNHTYEEYINHLNLVWAETYRVLDGGCRLCIDIGDQYARSVYYGRYKVIPIRTEIIKSCETIGFDYMGAIIWQKVATTNTSGGAAIMGSFPYPRNGILKLDYEFILVFKKIGKSLRTLSKEIKEKSRMTKEEWNRFFTGHWNFPGEKQKNHLAMFPLELPLRLIKMFSFEEDTVLDPFLGSGTTSLAALQLNRNSVGYEINPQYLPVIQEKLGMNTKQLPDQPRFEIIHQPPIKIDFKSRISQLHYIFKDPIQIDANFDPREMQFGSKINVESKPREEYFSVKEVLSPGLICLKDGRKVRMIGIIEDPLKKNEAVLFLEQKLKGTRIFLRMDNSLKTQENPDLLLAYVFLKNKTFINARLIKTNLVHVDESTDYYHKNRFLKYKKEAEQSTNQANKSVS